MDRRRFLELGVAAAVAGCRPARAPAAAKGPTEAFDGKIQHLVVLMLENRSYDQMLGALAGPEHDGVPHGARLPYEDAQGTLAWADIKHGAPPDRFWPDPGHSFRSVEAQILGSGIDRPADMAGFARRFRRDHPSVDATKLDHYVTLYGDGHLPILQGLAKEYGICSHWFCSLPSSTTPNRMFAHAGTSRGATRAGAYYSRVRGLMIFDKLGTRDPRAWRVYFHDMPHLWLAGDTWTKTFSGHFQFMPAFEKDVREDRLPTYSFLEPQHILPPWSSQHPAGGVSHGEKLIASVYNTLVSNPRVFEKSLLLIVYDEHGGFYDHVVPPGYAGWERQCPGVEYEVVRPDEALGTQEGPGAPYAFTTLGPRVPAVVVSPWIERGSVFGWKARDAAKRATFDHTSILATVGRMTGAWVDSKRARAATSLEIVLNRDAARTDYPRSLVFDRHRYAAKGLEDEAEDIVTDDGVAREISDAWREAHGEATPSQMVEDYRAMLGHS